MKPVSLAAHGAAVILVGSLVLVAKRAGGGPERAPPAPSAKAGDVGPKGSLREQASGFEAHVRLVDAVAGARFQGQNQAQGLAILSGHWRKMTPPWIALSPEQRKLVTSIALRTSATETQWSVGGAATGTKAWTPDARVWNMNEGSFDQRDALVAPTPATIAYSLEVPDGARLEYTPGTSNANGETTVFTVEVVDASGQTHTVDTVRHPPALARRWGAERVVDLARFSGQNVELRLSTVSVPPAADEPPPQPPRRRKRAEDDGDGPEPPPDVGVTPGAGSVALLGNPTVLRRTAGTRVPYNVLWIVVDALRPDVIASFHDDEEDRRVESAAHPPLEAHLPKIPGLTPVLDALAKKSVRFTRAYSAGAWTRPGTLSMLAGARSSELGIETMNWVLQPAATNRFYASTPPLLPLLLRREGVVTRAFVNNYFMVGYAPVGVDMGFERVDDHRYRTRDTLEITHDATAWIRAHADTRFFAFCNYNSPHEPWEPPAHFLARVPPPPEGPRDPITRLYMAEAAKDDEAIGQLLAALEDAKILDRTIVVVTADHGETLSSAHGGVGPDKMPIRYHHAAGNFEETTRIPILVKLPPGFPADRQVKDRVRSLDIPPTLLEVLGLEPNPRMTGKSLLGLARGNTEPDARVVVTEGRGTRAILSGRHRLLVREGFLRPREPAGDDEEGTFSHEDLYDLEADPGERVNLARRDPATLKEMHARLQAALKNVPVAGSDEARRTPDPARGPGKATVRLRFAGAGASRRVAGILTVDRGIFTAVTPVNCDAGSLRHDGGKLEIALVTARDGAVGFDLVTEPEAAPIAWRLYLDDAPWPDGHVYCGPYGLFSTLVGGGLGTDDARAAAYAEALPPIDPVRDLGLFVTRDKRGDRPREEATGEGTDEMNRLLREWGYAQDNGTSGKKPTARP